MTLGAERRVEVAAAEAGLAVHAPRVRRNDVAMAAPARSPGERRVALLRRHRMGAVAIGAARRALHSGGEQDEVHASLDLPHLVAVAAGAGAGRGKRAVRLVAGAPIAWALFENPVWQSMQACCGAPRP